jgi:hypothetical protein
LRIYSTIIGLDDAHNCSEFRWSFIPQITIAYGFSMTRREAVPDKTPHLTLDDVQFFERAMDAWESVRDTKGARDYFVPVDQFMRGRELLVAMHKTASRFLSVYIQQCPLTSLRRLFTSFCGHFQALCLDRFASHAVEELIVQANASLDDGFRELCASLITEVTPAASALAEDTAGSHVARVILAELSTAATLVGHVDKFARKILQHLRANPGVVHSPQFSATLQAIGSLDKQNYPKILNYLIEVMPMNWDAIRDKNASKAIEVMIERIGQPAITAVFAAVFRDGNAAADAGFDPIANFVIQHWLEFAEAADEIVVVADQILPIVPRLLTKRPQVIVSLTTALRRADEAHQQALVAALLTEGKSGLLEFLIGLSPPNGSRILQGICEFEPSSTKKLTRDLRKMAAESLAELANDTAGSFFLSAFFESQKIPLAGRRGIIEQLLPHMEKLALRKTGSFVIEAAFKCSPLETKSRICEALRSETVRQQVYVLWQKFRMDHFIRNREQWKRDTEALARQEEAMAEIIADVGKTDVEPIAPVVVAPTLEMQAAKQELESVIGGLHRRRKHRHSTD